MSKEDVWNKVKEAIINMSLDKICFEDIKENGKFSEDYGIDSIAFVSIMLDMEDEFHIRFEEDVFKNNNMNNVSVFVDQIMLLKNKVLL